VFVFQDKTMAGRINLAMNEEFLFQKMCKETLLPKLKQCNDQILSYFAWLCAVRALPCIGYKGDFVLWRDITFDPKYIESLFIALDCMALTLDNSKKWLERYESKTPDSNKDYHSRSSELIYICNNTNLAALANAASIIDPDAIEIAVDDFIEASIHSMTPHHDSYADYYERYLCAIQSIACTSSTIDFYGVMIAVYASAGYAIKAHTSPNVDCTINAALSALEASVLCTKQESMSNKPCIDMAAILSDDLDVILGSRDKYISITCYGPIWEKFATAMNTINCSKWVEIYKNIFDSQFAIDTESTYKRLMQTQYSDLRPSP